MDLLTASDVEEMFSWTPGKAQRMARKNLLPFVRLPGGEIRFERAAIMASIQRSETKLSDAAARTVA